MGFLSKHGLALCGDTVLITYGSGHHQVVRTRDPNVDGVIEEVLTKHWKTADCKLKSINLGVMTQEGPVDVMIRLNERKLWSVEYNPAIPYADDHGVYTALNSLFKNVHSQNA